MPNPENVLRHKIKKGEVRNPKGRKKGSKNVSTILKELLEVKDKQEGGQGDYGHPLAKELIQFVFQKKGSKYVHSETTRLRAMEQIVDRLEGKASQPISLDNGQRHNFNITFRNGDNVNESSEVQRDKPETD